MILDGHLRGIHNSCVGFYDNSQNWITHVIFQDITLQRLTAEPRNNSAMGLDARKVGKPVVIDEYGYEGNIAMTWGSIAPREAVEMHWSIVMAGAMVCTASPISRNSERDFCRGVSRASRVP